MQEPGSKQHFAARFQIDSKKFDTKTDTTLRVLSVGLRKKLLFQVYTFGIYAEEKGLGALVGSLGRVGSASELEKNVKFYDAFINSGSFAKALTLVFLREITGEDMSEAFDVSIGERLQKMKPEDNASGRKALQQFKEQFVNKKLRPHSTAAFIIEPGFALTTIIQDKRAGPTITSAPLCRALFDVYFGATPIDAKAKLSLARNAFMIHKNSASSSEGAEAPKAPRAKL